MRHTEITSDRSPDRVRGLLVLNAVLLIVLAVVTFGPSAEAQQRIRGEYTMVAGGVSGADTAAVYIADVVNQELVAVIYNQQTKDIEGIGYRNLSADAAATLRGRLRPTN